MTATPDNDERRSPRRRGSTVAEVRVELGHATVLASSSRWDWAGTFQADEFGPYRAERMTAPPRDHIVVTTTLEPSTTYVRQTREGRVFVATAGVGDSLIIPVGQPTQWDGLMPGHLRVALSPAMVAEVAEEVYGTGARRMRIRPVMRTADPVLARLADLAVQELRAPEHSVQRLMVDSLASAVAAQLLRGYAGLDEPRTTLPGVTGAGMRRALEYIHQRPTANPALAELADVAGLSRHHFARAFRSATGESPVHYVERIRIEHSIRLLRGGSLSLAEVASAVGFSDQSHFTRRFRAHTGTTPGRYRGGRTFVVSREIRPAADDPVP